MTTARQLDLIQWIIVIGVPLVSIGVVWGTTQAAIQGKLDAQRFVNDSTARASREVNRDSLLFREVRTVRLIICQDRPRDGWCLR